MKVRPIIRGVIGYIPGLLDSLKNRKEHTGTVSADYCYSVWLRHLILLNNQGLSNFETVAEIGPGASLGIGLSAMLCGTNTYYAFDLIEHTAVEENLKILGKLVELFKGKSNIPSVDKFPKVKPYLETYEFPKILLTDELINTYLLEERVSLLYTALNNLQTHHFSDKIRIEYKAPWYNSDLSNQVDLIVSQAVFEHILDLELALSKMCSFLKKGGTMSHVIDYTSHETHEVWNGHWAYSDTIWTIISKGRSYPINRRPHSYYLDLFTRNNLTIQYMQPTTSPNGISRDKIPAKNRASFTDSDMNISGCYFILQKN